jgi:class 3 adenylate cyclase
MSDLRGFTALIADMEPEQVITFLNRFLGKMIEVLVDARAVIDEIVGDGILAFFGAPEPMEDHAARAVACALNMQAAMGPINALNDAEGLPHLQMGVAINTGTVVVGNIGSEQRAKYSVVGAHVNFTGRIEACALGGQVLISESTYLRVRNLVELRGRQEVQMKGVSGPVTIYEVAGIGGPYNIHLEEQVETLTPLPERLNAHLYRMADKVVTGHWTPARITYLGETGAILLYEGELEAWEDVRLHLLDEQDAEIPGKIYGKVISVKDGDGAFREVQVRFTSVAAEILPVIRRAAGGA